MMNNIIKDIKENCEDKTVEGIVKYLTRSGDIAYTSEYHREIVYFYLEARKMPQTHREAKQTTIQLFNISSPTFKRIMRKYKGSLI